ncbi:hypothetical protein RhiirC2_762862, partial [Rhizophagus irregularis]
MVIGSLPAVPPPMIGVRAQASPQQINTGMSRPAKISPPIVSPTRRISCARDKYTNNNTTI